MNRLDRLDWAAGFSVRAFGSRVGVRSDDERLIGLLRDRMPPECRPCRSPVVGQLFSVVRGGTVAGTRARRFGLLYAGYARQLRTLDEGELLETFEALVRTELVMNATRWVFLHAAVVGWRGRAIVLPAASGAGKSSLVEALVRAGATYYSDEFAPLDSHGRVHPFAKPISRRLESGGVERVSAMALGSAPPGGGLPVEFVVLTRYERDARWAPRALAPGETVLALLPHTSRVRSDTARVLRRLARVAERTTAVTTPRGEADRAAADILEWANERIHAVRGEPAGLVATGTDR